MSKLKSLLAHTWVLLATPIVFMTFVAMPRWSALLVDTTGVKISPWHIGGDVMRETEHAGYRTVLRRPVFDALIGQRSVGFVQVEWLPVKGGVLPARIEEDVDYDNDGLVEFAVDLDTAANQVRVAPRSPRVLGLDRIYKLEGERVIRVRIRRE
jgi:hypothetical protein